MPILPNLMQLRSEAACYSSSECFFFSKEKYTHLRNNSCCYCYIRFTVSLILFLFIFLTDCRIFSQSAFGIICEPWTGWYLYSPLGRRNRKNREFVDVLITLIGINLRRFWKRFIINSGQISGEIIDCRKKRRNERRGARGGPEKRFACKILRIFRCYLLSLTKASRSSTLNWGLSKLFLV